MLFPTALLPSYLSFLAERLIRQPSTPSLPALLPLPAPSARTSWADGTTRDSITASVARPTATLGLAETLTNAAPVACPPDNDSAVPLVGVSPSPGLATHYPCGHRIIRDQRRTDYEVELQKSHPNLTADAIAQRGRRFARNHRRQQDDNGTTSAEPTSTTHAARACDHIPPYIPTAGFAPAADETIPFSAPFSFRSGVPSPPVRTPGSPLSELAINFSPPDPEQSPLDPIDVVANFYALGEG